MVIEEIISCFHELGSKLESYISSSKDKDPEFYALLDKAYVINPWFTSEFSITALKAIRAILYKSKLEEFIENYPGKLFSPKSPKTVGVVMAGNIPLVGFHDLLCILIAGHQIKIKLSSKDEVLMRFVVDQLIDINSEFQDLICFEEEHLSKIDALIATGSNNTSRYFQYYFGKYPHIIRKNRNSIAVLSGNENEDELKNLAKDIFLYFGLGCRNVSKLFVPEGYEFKKFFETIECYNFVYKHNKYANNYDYNKAIYLMNKVAHLDNGFMLLTQNEQIASPIGVVYYDTYKDPDQIKDYIQENRDSIQCIATHTSYFTSSVSLGQTQYPGLNEYADDIDTLKFLLELN